MSHLVGADDEDDAVHVGLRAHFLFHLCQPAVEGVEALPEANIVHQQHALTVLVKFISYLKQKEQMGCSGSTCWRPKALWELKPHLVKEWMTGHVEDVHFDFSVSDLHSSIKIKTMNTTLHCACKPAERSVDSLCDAIVDADCRQVLWNKPLLAVTFNDAALRTKTCFLITLYVLKV